MMQDSSAHGHNNFVTADLRFWPCRMLYVLVFLLASSKELLEL
jgi:hypothetical protein